MSTLTIQLPEGVARQLRECADREGVTVDHLPYKKATFEDYVGFGDWKSMARRNGGSTSRMS